MKRLTSILPLLAALPLLLMAGACTIDSGPEGSQSLLPIGVTGGTDGTGDDSGGGRPILEPSGGDGEVNTVDSGDGGGDAGTSGMADTNGDIDTGGTDDGGDGISEQPPAEGTPSVVLSVTPSTPVVGQTLFLSCTVVDSGGSPPTSYSFDSSAGSLFIVQDGSPIASVEVLSSLPTFNLWCQATNAAGQGPPSPLVTVSATGGGF
jgi:hypothetical protein